MLNGTFYVKNAIQYNLQQQMFVTSWNKILQEFIPVCLQMSDSDDARERTLQELQNRRDRLHLRRDPGHVLLFAVMTTQQNL